MSLSSILKGKKEQDKKFQQIIKSMIPDKKIFQTISGKKAFSEYDLKINSTNISSYEASLLGTAFDYLARAMIGNIIKENKINATLRYKAFTGLKFIESSINSAEYSRLYNKYTDALCNFIKYIYSDLSLMPDVEILANKCDRHEWDAWVKYLKICSSSTFDFSTDIDSLIDDAVFFAKLEHIYRSGMFIPESGIKSLLKRENEYIHQELKEFCKVFKCFFIETGLVNHNSVVIFNPDFGIASYACGGADADICIDGTLYDFKTSKNVGYKWQEIAQITAYFLLNIIVNSIEGSVDRNKFEIYNIAIYRARYGEIEYCSVSSFIDNNFQNKFDEFSNHLLERLENPYSF